MKRNIAIFSLVTGLILGSTVLRDTLPTATGLAQSTSQNTTQTPFNEAAARLQNEQNTVDIVNRYQDGVVYVSTYSSEPEDLFGGSQGIDPFEYFFGQRQPSAPQEQPAEPRQTGVGSGFFIDNQGYILTNNHVVQGASQIKVRLHKEGEGREFTAKVVGTAPDYDLALLKVDNIDQNTYVPMQLGNSDDVVAGQKSIAMGAPFDLEFTVTEGIISAVGRVIPTGERGIPQKAIQTDAAINPGNSGGPLLNSRGEVIGINTQIVSPGARQSAGIGFAIPINVAKTILPQLKAGKTVSGPRLGLTGVGIEESVLASRSDILEKYKLPKKGVLVQEVSPNSPAAKAGIQGGTKKYRTPDPRFPEMSLDGDVITKLNGKEVNTIGEIQAALFAKKPGDVVKVDLFRAGNTRSVNVTLEDN